MATNGKSQNHVCDRIYMSPLKLRPEIRNPYLRCQSQSLSPKLDHYLTFIWPCIVTDFFIIKPTRLTNFTNWLRHETLHLSGSSSANHQKFIHCTLINGICHTGLKTAFEQDQDVTVNTVPSWSCSKAVFKTCMTYTSAECTANKLLIMGRGTARNMQSFMPE
jgi:hypothetical protein